MDGPIVIDILHIEPEKPFLIQHGGYAYYCDFYFPKDDYLVLGNIIVDPDVPYEDQKVICSTLKSNGTMIHELSEQITVKSFMHCVRYSQMLEEKKLANEVQSFRQGVAPPDGDQYA